MALQVSVDQVFLVQVGDPKSNVGKHLQLGAPVKLGFSLVDPIVKRASVHVFGHDCKFRRLQTSANKLNDVFMEALTIVLYFC